MSNRLTKSSVDWINNEAAFELDNFLVERAKAGDSWAFGELWRRHEGRVRRILTAQLGYKDNAIPDLTQDTFLKAFRSIAQYDGNARFSTWLYTIAMNASFDYFRREKRHANDVCVDEAFELPGYPPLDGDVSLRLSIAKEELLQMDELPQAIIRLLCWDGLSSSEVASFLGIKRQKVYDTLKAFRVRLRRKMAGYSKDGKAKDLRKER